MRPEAVSDALVDVLDRVLTKGIVIADGQRGAHLAIVVDSRSVVSLQSRGIGDDAVPADGLSEALIAAAEHYLGRLPTSAPHLSR